MPVCLPTLPATPIHLGKKHIPSPQYWGHKEGSVCKVLCPGADMEMVTQPRLQRGAMMSLRLWLLLSASGEVLSSPSPRSWASSLSFLTEVGGFPTDTFGFRSPWGRGLLGCESIGHQGPEWLMHNPVDPSPPPYAKHRPEWWEGTEKGRGCWGKHHLPGAWAIPGMMVVGGGGCGCRKLRDWRRAPGREAVLWWGRGGHLCNGVQRSLTEIAEIGDIVTVCWTLSHLILTIVLWGRFYDPHFIGETGT